MLTISPTPYGTLYKLGILLRISPPPPLIAIGGKLLTRSYIFCVEKKIFFQLNRNKEIDKITFRINTIFADWFCSSF